MSYYMETKIAAMERIPPDHPPCSEPRNVNGQIKYMKPAVNCGERECAFCGWNPVVQKQRLVKAGLYV